jgi:hypothetical protein
MRAQQSLDLADRVECRRIPRANSRVQPGDPWPHGSESDVDVAAVENQAVGDAPYSYAGREQPRELCGAGEANAVRHATKLRSKQRYDRASVQYD